MPGVLRRVGIAALTVLIGAIGLSACGSSPSGSAKTGSGASCSYHGLQSDLYQKGRLTVATDTPAYWPWFYKNKPSDGVGYESAVAYEVAKLLGFKRSQVHWVVEPFNASYQPGPKHFDFDINEISYTRARAQEVTFSTSYYDVQQALVALRGSAIVKHHTPADLRKYIYGDVIGTTSLALIESKIRPTHTPAIFDTLNDVKSAIEAKRIDAFVTDTPTAQYIAGSEIPGTIMVAQFPSTGEHYGLLFGKGDKLARCVDRALATMRKDGFLARQVKRYLGLYTKVPTIKP